MAKRNYISARMEYGKISSFIIKLIHDLREGKNIDYLLKEQAKKLNIDFENEFKNFHSINKKEAIKKLEELQKRKLEIYKKRGTGQRKNENEILEFLVAFSEEQARHYLKEDPQALYKISKKFSENLKKEYGIETISVSFHADEGHIDKETGKIKYNFHAHIIAYNYDFEKEQSILRTLRKNDFSKMQDLAEKSAKELGFDFKRGEKKENTNARHLKVREYKEAREKINIINFLEKKIKQIDEKKEKIRKDKNNTKEQIKLINKQLTAQKRIYQKELKEIKKNINGYDIDTTKEKIKNIFNKVFNEMSEKRYKLHGEKILKPEHLKFLFNDMMKELEKEIEENFFSGNFETLKILQKEKEELKKEIKEKEQIIENKEKEKEQLKEKIKEINGENLLLKYDKDKLKEEVKKNRINFFEFHELKNDYNNLKNYNNKLKEEEKRKTKIINILENKEQIIENNFNEVKTEYKKIENNFNNDTKENILNKFNEIEKRKPEITEIKENKENIFYKVFKSHLNYFINLYNKINKVGINTTVPEITEIKENEKELKEKIKNDINNIEDIKEVIDALKDTEPAKEVKEEKREPKRKRREREKSQSMSI